MKILLKESQIKNLMEASLYYGDEKLPELISNVTKDISEAKKICSKFLTMFKSLNVGEIFEQPSHFVNIINQMRNIHKKHNDKSKNYYTILDTFENDFDNKPLMKFEHLVLDFENVVMDMYDITEKTDEIIEMVIDNEEIKEKYKYLEREYPEETIDVSGGLQIIPK